MEGKVPNSSQSVAFFDLDKTIIAKSATLAYAKPFRRAAYLRRRTLLRAAVAQVVYLILGSDQRRLDRLRNRLLSLTKGWNAQAVRQLVRETVEDVIAPLVYAEALALMEDHRRQGRKIIIVSAAPEEVVEPLGKYLGNNQVIASRSKIDQQGCYTGELAFYGDGLGKAQAISRLVEETDLDLDECYAYSDSASDLPMLEMVGHPTAVNPDRELRKIAEDRKWPTLYFSRPVNLRSRLADLPKATPIISGTALAVTATAAVLWWLLTRRRTA